MHGSCLFVYQTAVGNFSEETEASDLESFLEFIDKLRVLSMVPDRLGEFLPLMLAAQQPCSLALWPPHL